MKRLIAIIFLCLGLSFVVVATRRVLAGTGLPVDPNAHLAYYVGTYLPAVVLLIIGLIVWGKSKPGAGDLQEA